MESEMDNESRVLHLLEENTKKQYNPFIVKQSLYELDNLKIEIENSIDGRFSEFTKL